eukprot:scaffold12831_cov129-Isochrysis_galbana.AAC.7
MDYLPLPPATSPGQLRCPCTPARPDASAARPPSPDRLAPTSRVARAAAPPRTAETSPRRQARCRTAGSRRAQPRPRSRRPGQHSQSRCRPQPPPGVTGECRPGFGRVRRTQHEEAKGS